MHDLCFLRNSTELQRWAAGTHPGFHAQQKRGGFDPTNHHRAASTLGRESKYSHNYTTACVLKNQQHCLPHHFWHSYISSGSAGWFEENLSLLDIQRAQWLKPQLFFLPVLAEQRCWAPKDEPPVVICAWINLSYLRTCRSTLFWMQPLWTPATFAFAECFQKSLASTYSLHFFNLDWLKSSLSLSLPHSPSLCQSEVIESSSLSRSWSACLQASLQSTLKDFSTPSDRHQ